MKRFALAAIAAVGLVTASRGQTTTTSVADPTTEFKTLFAYDASRTPTAQTTEAQNDLSTYSTQWTVDQLNQTRELLATLLLAQGQTTQIEPVLQQIENSSTTYANDLSIASGIRGDVYMKQNDLADAKASYQKALQISAAGDGWQVLAMTRKLATESVAEGNPSAGETAIQNYINGVVAKTTSTPADFHYAYDAMSQFYQATNQTAKEQTLVNNVIQANNVGTFLTNWQTLKATLISNTDHAAAITYIQSTPPDPQRLTLLAKLTNDVNVITTEVVRYIAVQPVASFTDDELAVIRQIVPANDSMVCMLTDPQTLVVNLNVFLRHQNGLLNNTQVAAFVEQLQNGDGTKLLTSTPTTAAIAVAISNTSAPMKTFLVPLFSGDYPTAAKAAFTAAKAANSDTEYRVGVKQLANVVRCNDQCFNKRAIDVIKWINGDVTTNPISDLLGQ